jgi:hypothetical protein
MTRRLSDAKDHHRLPTADPFTTGCARPSSARNTIALTPNRSAFPGLSSPFIPVSGTMRSLSRAHDAAVAPTVLALSP